MKHTNDTDLAKPLVVVSGCGLKESTRSFHEDRYAVIHRVGDRKYKLNVGAATAMRLLEEGYDVLMVSKSGEKLGMLNDYLVEAVGRNAYVKEADLICEAEVVGVRDHLATAHGDRTLWFVHSVGLSAGAYQVSGDNPYLPIHEVTPELVIREYQAAVSSFLLFLRVFMPVFRRQEETRMVVVNSMSAIRPYLRGFSHSAAKGGLFNAVRAATLEFYNTGLNVRLSQVLPGMIDTGVYDGESAIDAISDIGSSFGVRDDKKWTSASLPLMSPNSIARAVFLALSEDAHFLNMEVVACGQIPHRGA